MKERKVETVKIGNLSLKVSNDKFKENELVCDGLEIINASSKLVSAQGLVDRRNWRKVVKN